MSETSSVTTIDLLRHGECTGGAIFRGHTDSVLSSAGEQQMRHALDKLRAHHDKQENPWQTIVSSPLQRCASIAHSLVSEQQTPVLDAAFQEISFGDWDGQTIEKIRAEQPQRVEAFWRDPSRHTPPNGESLEGFELRIDSAWQALLKNQRGNTVLLICHGGVVRMLLAQLLSMPLHALPSINVPYGCISRIQIHHQSGSPDWPQLVFHNA